MCGVCSVRTELRVLVEMQLLPVAGLVFLVRLLMTFEMVETEKVMKLNL